MSTTKDYMGDSVYADIINGNVIRLTTENDSSGNPSNEIFVEPDVLLKIIRYANRMKIISEV